MNAIVYKITCVTNLHVGSGEANFDVIDNTVEKDPVTELPTINSSGVKGALRQYFVERGVKSKDITDIFGSSPKESAEVETVIKTEEGKEKSKNEPKTIPGQVKFYQADLLARPARASKGDKSYYMVTSAEAIAQHIQKMKIFADTDINAVPKNCVEVGVEGITAEKEIELLNESFKMIEDVELRDMPLPVLARNQLEDGISNNLWYEQVVPHKSIFTFAVSSESAKILNTFAKVVEENPYIQFGGNASIGYGLCKVEEIGRNYPECNEVTE